MLHELYLFRLSRNNLNYVCVCVFFYKKKRMPITRIEPKTSDTTVHSHDHWATIYCTYYYSNYTLFKQFWLFIVNLQLYRYVKAILLEVQNYFKISNLCMFLNGYTKKKDTAHFEFDISIHINYIL